MYVIICCIDMMLFNFDFDVCFTRFSTLAPKSTWYDSVADTDLLKAIRKCIRVIHKLLGSDPKIGQGMADLIMQGDHAGTKERMEQQSMKKEGYTGHAMAANIIASAFFKKSYTLQKGQPGGTTPQRCP